VALDHLRRGAIGRVHAVERVEDHVAVVAGDVREGRHRIERDQILLRDEAQGRDRLRADKGRRCNGAGDEGAGSLQQRASLYPKPPAQRRSGASHTGRPGTFETPGMPLLAGTGPARA